MRVQYANDPDNLILVYGPTNEAKGDRDPTEWLPPRKEYIPEYLDHWQKICGKYPLDCSGIDFPTIRARNGGGQ
jgi:hypothetical protein